MGIPRPRHWFSRISSDTYHLRMRQFGNSPCLGCAKPPDTARQVARNILPHHSHKFESYCIIERVQSSHLGVEHSLRGLA